MTLCKRWGLITNPLYQMSTVDNDEEGKEGRREGRELDLTESCIAIRRFRSSFSGHISGRRAVRDRSGLRSSGLERRLIGNIWELPHPKRIRALTVLICCMQLVS